jgi:hypothetical protein
MSPITFTIFIKLLFFSKIEAISKKGFWFKFKAGPNFKPQATTGSALGVHTAVFRGFEARDRHRYNLNKPAYFSGTDKGLDFN